MLKHTLIKIHSQILCSSRTYIKFHSPTILPVSLIILLLLHITLFINAKKYLQISFVRAKDGASFVRYVVEQLAYSRSLVITYFGNTLLYVVWQRTSCTKNFFSELTHDPDDMKESVYLIPCLSQFQLSMKLNHSIKTLGLIQVHLSLYFL